ncbi:MAG: CPBP family intramembrane glutamic endopeptidase [Gaiellales bacterium]
MTVAGEPAPPAPGAGARGGARESLALLIWLSLTGMLVVLSFLPAAEGGRNGGEPEVIYRYSTVVGGVIQSAILIGVALGAGTLLPGRLRALGFNPFPRRALLQAAGVVAAAFAVGIALEPVLEAGEKQGLAPEQWHPELLTPFVLNVILFAVIGPFTEELYFRGLGGAVLRRFGPALAIAGTAVLWSLVHGLVEAIPTLLVLGIGFGWIRMRYESIWPAFIAHGAYNGLAIAVSVGLT